MFGLAFNRLHFWWRSIDKAILIVAICLLIFGFVSVLSASQAVSSRIMASRFLFAKKQLIFVFLGIATIIFISMLPKEVLAPISLIAIGSFLIMMLFLAFFGTKIKGSARWISLGGFAIQPSDLMKPFFVFINGIILRRAKEKMIIKFGISLGFLSVVGFLLFLQPDIGMLSIYIVLWLAQLFVAGLPWFYVATAAIGFFAILALAYLVLPHARYRISSFFSDEMSYQTKRAMESLSAGGWFGKGIGRGDVKYNLPDAHSDYIFSAIGEEWGGIVCLLLLFAYLFLVLKMLAIFNMSGLPEMQIIGVGLVMIIAAHVLFCTGVNLDSLPSKGTTLPFVSYGGSSTISSCLVVGLVLNLSRRLQYQSPFEIVKRKIINI